MHFYYSNALFLFWFAFFSAFLMIFCCLELETSSKYLIPNNCKKSESHVNWIIRIQAELPISHELSPDYYCPFEKKQLADQELIAYYFQSSDYCSPLLMLESELWWTTAALNCHGWEHIVVVTQNCDIHTTCGMFLCFDLTHVYTVKWHLIKK